MVQQRHECDVAAFEAFDDPGLPQRPVAIQRVGVDLLDELAELLHSAGSGTDDAAHVRVEIELGVLDPDRVMQAQRRRQVPQPEDGKQVGAFLEHPPRLRPRPAVGVRRRVEHADLQRVVVGAAAVEVQHQCIDAVESSHHGRASSRACRRGVPTELSGRCEIRLVILCGISERIGILCRGSGLVVD